MEPVAHWDELIGNRERVAMRCAAPGPVFQRQIAGGRGAVLSSGARAAQ